MIMINKIQNYIKQSIIELKKVSWPTRKETKNYTITVIVLSIVISSFLGALDVFFSSILKSIL